LATVSFTGFSTEDGASFDEFVNCAREHGVEIPMTPPSGTVPVVEPVAPEIVRDAWAACRDVFAAAQRSSQQGSPEFLTDSLAQLDCMAEAGYSTILQGQPSVRDMAAQQAAFASCQESSPGRLALVECLSANGLGVVVDGVVSGGPHPPERAQAAWAACRDVFITWSMPNLMMAETMLGPLDCAAALGWITVIINASERANPQLGPALAQCRATTP
jgi:hypothetical protein